MPHRTDSAARRLARQDLCPLLICLLNACTVGGPGHEIILADAGVASDRAADASSAPQPASNATGGSSVAQSASAGASAADSGAAAGSAAQGGGASGSAGSAPAQAGAPSQFPATPDAGAQLADDAGTEPPADPATCAFNFAGCVVLDPLGFADCATQAGPGCAEILLGSDADQAPSAACAMQEADCLMRDPSQVDACMTMLANCTL
jgi:hypothetical protein